MGKRIRYEVWRANKNGTGFAAIFEYNEGKKSWFAVMMPQQGDGFDHTKKFQVKLGLSDLGAMLPVLSGRINTVGEKGIYHSSSKDSKDNSVISLNANEHGGFFFGISQKKGDTTVKGSVILSLCDAVILTELFRQTVMPMCTEEFISRQDNQQAG